MHLESTCLLTVQVTLVSVAEAEHYVGVESERVFDDAAALRIALV